MSSDSDLFIEYLLVHYRWVLVCFLLPVSFVYDVWFYLRNWLYFKISSAPSKHFAKVERIQKQIQEWIKTGKKKKMCTARPGWQTMCIRRPGYKESSYRVEVNLVDILEINREEKWVRVEPMVKMGQLTAMLNPLGWTIPVVPELDDLTVGGLVMGTGIESSSHRYGLFQHACLSYELVLSDGSLVDCSKDNDPELFYSVPWSYGTLGLLTAVKIKLIPTKKYIKLEYHPVRGLDEIVRKFREASESSHNTFIEGLVFSPNEAVIMTGNFADEADIDKINKIGKWYKPWFFKHVQSKLQSKSSDKYVEYIPLRDYYHRHTRSFFWEAQDIVPFGNHPLFRYLLGWLMPPKVSLLKLTQTEAVTKLYDTKHVIQDMLVPVKYLKESIEVFHKEFEVYPLWLCPFILPSEPGMVHSTTGRPEMYVDVGIYGVPKAENFKPRESTRAIEKYVVDHQGFQMLYADTYTSREEFRIMFDHSLYDKQRKRLNCEDAFPEVYDKVKKNARI